MSKKMQAYVLQNIGDFSLKSVIKPSLRANEVLVNVKASGICGSDINRIYKTGAYTHPLIPGHEFAGIVEAVSETADQSWVGKRVGIFPLIPCRKCKECQNNHFEMCNAYSYLGSRCNGGYAEYVAVPEANLIEIAPQVSFKEAAMLEPLAVAIHALRGYDLLKPLADREKKIMVCGLGTIGLMIVKILSVFGYQRILAIGNKDIQRNKADEICNVTYIDLRENTDWFSESSVQGVDFFFECVGKNETLDQALFLAAPLGKVMLVGNPHTDMNLVRNSYWQILRKQMTLKGTWNSSFIHDEEDDWHLALKLLGEKKISVSDLISHEFSPADLIKGFEIMHERRCDYIKIMGIY
ncbi:MAG: galactitol-1-phosphate 5-dehydrogenase [Lachnospiraceae bacterium]|nr:galactitol-1-phosphate 5-dehydrogenase [Lachnospiraceae bacterium]